METVTIETLAREASSGLEVATREDGTLFRRKRDDAPAWIENLVYHAHGRMLPDDWRYSCISAALCHLADDGDPDDAHEFADGHVDIYTGRLIEWLASSLSRVVYCDEAASEFGVEPGDIAKAIGIGQYAEAVEVYGLVVEALRERADELDSK